MAKDTLQEIEKKISKLQEERRKQLDTCRNTIATETAKADAAASVMETAAAAGDMDAYVKAKGQRTEALDAAEFAQKRIAYLDKTPLVSNTEAQEVITDLLEEAEANNKALADKIVDLIEGELIDAAKEGKHKYEKANDLLRIWQQDVCKLDGAPKLYNKQHAAYSVVEAIINTNPYRFMSGLGVVNGGPIWRPL